MSAVRLAWHQYRYDQKTFWRDSAAVFFTVILPLIFLVIFASIFGNETVETDNGEIKTATYYVAGLLTLEIKSATGVNLAITLTSWRERGLLKRLRGTPLPTWAFLVGRIGTCCVITLLTTILLVGVGRVAYGVTIPTSTLPAAILALLVGTASLCPLGFALCAVIPTEN